MNHKETIEPDLKPCRECGKATSNRCMSDHGFPLCCGSYVCDDCICSVGNTRALPALDKSLFERMNAAQAFLKEG